MTSYIYFDCGCGFYVDDNQWDCEDLCKKHRKILDKEDYWED